MASIMHRPECIDAPFQMEMDSASDDTPSLKRKSISLNEDTDTPIAELSREQKRELRKRLKMELQQVQGINMKLEYLEQQVARSSSEKEVSSLVPPPIDVSRLGRQSSYVSELGTPGSTKEKRTPKANQMYSNSDYFSAKDKMPPPEKVKPKQLVPPKKGLKGEYDLKRQKVEQARSKRLSDMLKQCGNVLKKLMMHKFAWVFNTPVDAVKLGLHDYHKVIRKPMDLGTIKRKLESQQYSSPLEFADDVKLTFSNAMTYNPPGHDVFLMAETLKRIFDERWRSVSEKLEEDLTRRRAEDEVLAEFASQNPVKQLALNEELGTKKVAGPPRATSLKKPAKRLMTYDEKNQLGKNLELVLEKSPADKVDEIVQLIKKHHPNLSQSDDIIEVDIDGIDNDTLWELHRMVSDCMKIKTKKKPAKQEVIVDAAKNGSGAPGTSPKRGKNNGEGVEEDVDIDVGDEKPMGEIPSVVIDKDAPDKDKSSGESSSSSSGSSSSESDSGSSSGSDSDAEGPRTAGNEKPSSQKEPNGAARDQVSSPSRKVAEKPVTESPEQPDVVQNGDSTEAQGDKSAEKTQSERVSPEKSLRAAMLKGRFADTILKAREKTFPLKSDNIDPEKLRKEREELERKQREDKARLQAEAKAAEAVRLKKEAEAASEARKKRELEREAARRALQQMERTVDLDAHHEILKDFELMRSSSMEHLQSSAGEVSPANSGGIGGGIPGFTLLQNGGNPLEQLGLFMKEDEEDEEKQGDGEVAFAEGTDENGEVEEGEIDI